MNIFPAIDLYDGCAVRLYKGDYRQMSIFSREPVKVAKYFESKGARFLHMVDLEGARSGETPNFAAVKDIVEETGLYTELGGGIRSLEVMERYLEIGVDRLILGTAAITEPGFVEEAIERFGPEAVAVGVDISGDKVAIKGWTEVTDVSCDDFCARMQDIGVKSIICTDISKDGAMEGTNRQLYRHLSEKFDLDITASGGISTLEDVRELARMQLSAAILGKAIYTGDIDLGEALAAVGGIG